MAKKKKLKKMLRAMLEAAAAKPPEDTRTVSEWLEIHEREICQRGYAPQTLRNRRTLIAHCRRLWGDRPVRQLRPFEVAEGVRTFPAENSSTAGRVLRELRESYTSAIANDWAENNPAAVIKPPKHRVKRRRLTFEEWQAMLALAERHPQRWLKPMLLLALVTGQRRGDLVRMAFSDVVVDAADGQQYLRVEQEKKAGKPVGARVEIPLAIKLEAIGMTLGEVVQLCQDSAKPGPTMLRKAGGGALEKSSLSARFHELIVEVLGPGACRDREWPSLHEVRSLCARLFKAQAAAQRGQAVPRQALLGHKNKEMTELYEDDRGLSGGQWVRVMLTPPPPAAQELEPCPTSTAPALSSVSA